LRYGLQIRAALGENPENDVQWFIYDMNSESNVKSPLDSEIAGRNATTFHPAQ
jgi:hypothetical protein